VVTYKIVGEPEKTCSFNITVEDKEAPLIKNVSSNPNSIWPPNHEMIDVDVLYDISDNCGTVMPTVSISSNEAESGTDKDDVPNDWKVIDAHHVQVRAERSAKGSGRIYTIKILATDLSGNKSEQEVKVTVPHDKPDSKDEKDQFSVKVLSNPTRNFFSLFISSNKSESLSLRVINVLGRVVETRSDVSPNGTIKIGSDYHAGIYFAELKLGNKKEIVTLLKY
jgi:hypothetical protein